MALRIRKDIKKSSYYVWFLGAKESKGLRGKEFIIPIIDHLVLREKELEPHKVTLQISHKGLKIIQNVLSTNKSSNKPKSEIIKHFLPHDTITCVYQDEDIVSVLLLLYNPVTKCPLHCHVYRCDSVETASLLRKQLDVLIERPENQKKYEELETRLKIKVDAKKKFDSSIGSDTGTSTRESTSSDEHLSPEGTNTRIATLYDSLAAELRQKLNTKEAPILLPPRDYDTVHRQKGNLQNIDLRRCLNTSIVGQNAKNGRRIESSGGSSGIGSDHAPSPEGEDGFVLDNQSTSDEEWNLDPSESSTYLMNGPSDMILPRPSRHPEVAKFSPEPPQSPKSSEFHPENRFNRYGEDANPKINKDNGRKFDRYEQKDNKYYNQRYLEEDMQKYPGRFDENSRYFDNSKHRSSRYPDDFEEDIDYREKRPERPKEEPPRPRPTKYIEDDARYYQEDHKSERSNSRNKYYEEKTLSRSKNHPKDDQRYYSSEYEEKLRPNHDYERDRAFYPDTKTLEKTSKSSKHHQMIEDPRYYQEKSSRSRHSQEERLQKYYTQEDYFDEVPETRRYPKEIPEPRRQVSRSSQQPEEYFDDEIETRRHPNDLSEAIRRRPEDRQRSPTPPELNVSPRDRFKDAKEKFLMMERERLEEQERLRQEEIRRRQELSHSTPNLKDKTFLKRHDSMAYPKNPYQDEDRRHFNPETQNGRYQPKPAPRNINYENRERDYPIREYPDRENFRDSEVHYRKREPLDRYRSQDERYDKRRSMYNQIEDEHKLKSNEIARELKRRTYLESGSNTFERDHNNYYNREQYPDWEHAPRYPNSPTSPKRSDKEQFQFSKSNQDLDKLGAEKITKNPKMKTPNAGYRHSYAEPKLSLEKIGKKIFPDVLHRTNSNVTNSGRVGIASVNPY